MGIRRSSAALTTVTVLGLALAACSSTGPSEATADPARATQHTGPLGDYLAVVNGTSLSLDEQERRFDEQLAQEQQLVAQCMQDEGFDYTPDTVSTSFYSGEDVVWEPDDREWVSQYGYGLVVSPVAQASADDPDFADYVDPNGDYVESLSTSERSAFYLALNGPASTAGDPQGGDSYDWTTAGCLGAAQHEVAGRDVSQSAEFQQLFEAIDAFRADSASWPGMAELNAAWASCMDASGQSGYRAQTDAQAYIQSQLDGVYDAIPVDEDGDPTDSVDQDALDAVGEEEVQLALADLECRQETDFPARAVAVSDAAEQQFVDDHLEELQTLEAAAEQG